MTSTTLQGIFKYAALGAGALVAGPVISAAMGPLVSVTGAPDATLLPASSKGGAALAYVAAMVVAGALALASGLLSTRRVALFATGLALAWPAHTLGSVEPILRDAHSADAISGVLLRMAIEGVLVAVPLALIVHVASRLGDVNAPAALRASPEPAPLLSKDPVIGAAISAAVAAVVIYFAMPTSYNGQALGACAFAGALGALAAHAAAPKAPLAASFFGCMLVAVLGPIAARFTASGDPLAAVYAGEFLPVALVHPWHVAAGACIGVPVGDAWARSLIEKHAPTGESAAAAA